MATFPKSSGRRRSRHWASSGRGVRPASGGGRREAGGAVQRKAPARGPAAGPPGWSVPRRLRRRLPGGCGSPGGAGVRAASEGPKTPTPAWPPYTAGGRRWTQGRGPGLSTFPEPRVSAAAAGLPGFGRSEEPEPRGEGFQETKARAGGVGQRFWGLCADTCISRLWVFVDLGPWMYICLRLCVSLALRGFSPLCPRFVGPRLLVAVGGLMVVCPRTCSVTVDVSGLGVRGVCACGEPDTAPTPRSPAVHSGPRLGFKLFSRLLRQQPRPSPLQPEQGLLVTLPSFVSWGP